MGYAGPRSIHGCGRGASVKARFGVDHVNYGDTLYNLALVYLAQGEYADAEDLNKRALAIREKALGANHSNVAITLNNLMTQIVEITGITLK